MENTHRRLQAMTFEEQLANSRGRGGPSTPRKPRRGAGTLLVLCIRLRRWWWWCSCVRVRQAPWESTRSCLLP